jgi:ethanolamine phosphate phosphodiesterase
LFFLGDLFDGGREWKTARGNTADPAWANGMRPSGEAAYVQTWGKRYGEDFWLHEYDRFGRIFYKFWGIGGDEARPAQRGRKIISSLPGNHDLGFGAQIKVSVRDRFEAFFGEGNRVDVVGNHTIVSVDTVSLSAGSSEHATPEITQPVEDFLSRVQALKRKAVARELSLQAGHENVLQFSHVVEDLDRADFTHIPTPDPGQQSADFPTILLTHVPLYRGPGTPCGPHRERWPPTPPPKGQTSPVDPDDRNSISLSAGYQYQNVIGESDSVRVVSTIGNVVSVFSGDDHDYCDIVHPSNKNNAREITVKSMSWAMGVRRPGFLMLSMWNPVGPDGEPLHSLHTGHGAGPAPSSTLESHLCLLPDQLGIFIRYGSLLAITLFALLIRAILTPILGLQPFSISPDFDDSIFLPVVNKDIKRANETQSHYPDKSSTSSTCSNNSANLAPRSSAVRTRSVSPANGYGLPASHTRNTTPPLIYHAGYFGNGDGYRGNHDGGEDPGRNATSAYVGTAKQRKGGVLGLVYREAWMSIWRVAWIVLGVYCWLVWYG